MLFTLRELIDIVAMVAFVGFIFKDMFKQYAHDISSPEYYLNAGGFDWDGFKFAAMVTAPAIILHEFGHKFVAMLFGMIAQFNAAYMWLALGVILKLMGVGLIFFVPAYVRWGCPFGDAVCASTLGANPWIGSLIAFAGPGVNLILWLGSDYLIKHKKIEKKHLKFALLTAQINKFLFFFNMIPIPPFDGFGFVSNLLSWLF